MYAQNPMFSGVSPGRMAEARRFAQGGQMGRAKQQFELGGGQWNPQVQQRFGMVGGQQDNIGQMIPGPGPGGGPPPDMGGGPPMPPPGMGGGPDRMRTMELQPGDPGWEPGMNRGGGWGAFPQLGGGMGGGMGGPPMPPPPFQGGGPRWGGQGGGFGNQLGGGMGPPGMPGGGMPGGMGGGMPAGPPISQFRRRVMY